MVLIDYADKAPYIIAGAVYGATVAGLITYGYFFPRPKYTKKEVERAFRRARAAAAFESEYLTPLAINLAVREKTPEEDFGEDIDVSKIPATFNPFGEILEEFYSRNKGEKARLKRKLNKLVGRYRLRRAQN